MTATATANVAPVAKTVVADGMFTLAGRALRTILILALSVVIARVLGPHDRGLYALPTVVYTGLVVSLLGGVADAVSYFMLNTDAGRAVLAPAFLTGLIFVVIGAIFVAFFAVLDRNVWAISPALLLLPCNVPIMVLTGYAAGTKRIRWQTSYVFLFTLTLLCATLAGFVVFGGTLLTAIAAFVAVNALAAVICLAFVVRDARALQAGRISLRRFMFYALRVGTVNVVTLLNYRADLYVVALLTTPAILGQYAVAIGAAEALLIVTQIPATVSSPHVGSMAPRDAAAFTATCARMTLLLAVLLCGCVYLCAPYLVPLVYGNAYAPLVPALRILLIAVTVLSVSRPISNYFTLKTGTPEVGLISSGAAAAVCIGLSIAFVPRMGMVGGAIATALAYVAGEGIRILIFTRRARLSFARVLLPTVRDLRSCAESAGSVVAHVQRGAGAGIARLSSSKCAAATFVLLVSVTLSAYRVRQAFPEWTNDGSIYLAMTLRDRGMPEKLADMTANRFLMTTAQGRSHPEFYAADPPQFIVRQRQLFLNRPLYPLLASVLPFSAPSALKIVSGVSYALIPPLIFLLLAGFTQVWVATLAAVGAAAIPAVFQHAGLPLTDEPALFFWLAAFASMFAYARSPSPLRYAGVVLAAAALVFTRPAVPLLFGAAFGVAAARSGRGWVMPCSIFGGLIIVIVGFALYTQAAHGATLDSELRANYAWQLSIHGEFTTHGFALWRTLVALRAVLLLPKTLLANLGLFQIVVACIGIAIYRRSLLTAMSIGAFVGTVLTAVIASPLDVERTIAMPVLPLLVILASLGLAGLVQSKSQTGGPLPRPSFR